MAEFITTDRMPSGKEVNAGGYATYMLVYSKSVTGKLLTDLQSIWKPEIMRDGNHFAESVSVCTDRNTGATVPCKLPSNYKDQEFITLNTKTGKFYWAKNYADATAGKWTEITEKAKKAGLLGNPTLLDKTIKAAQEGSQDAKPDIVHNEGTSETKIQREGDEKKGGLFPAKWAQYFPNNPWLNPDSKNFWILLALIAAFAWYRNRRTRQISRRTARKINRRLAA